MTSSHMIQRAAVAVAAAACLSLLPRTAAAVDLLNIQGQMSIVSPISVQFGDYASGAPFAPAPGDGTFLVDAPVLGLFSPLTPGVSTGKIQSLDEGPGPVTLTAPFMTFDTTLSNLQLWATNIVAPSAGPSAFGMFTVQDLGGGHVGVSFVVSGYVFDTNTHSQVETFSFAASTTLINTSVAAFESSLPTNLDFSGQIVGTPGGVPEPSTWALMIAGFGGAGAALRRSRPGRRRETAA